MPAEIEELLEAAMYKEIASQAFYIASQGKTEDPGARALLQELAAEELRHSQWLKKLKEDGSKLPRQHQQQIPDLMIGEYLTASTTVEGAGLQETLIFAMKRELLSIDFYTRLMGIMSGEPAKRLCQRLVQEELRHKLKLELFYDDLFYAED